MKQVIAIVGPTGVGKTRLAVHLAQRFNGEIINADSRQVYRYMDIGTAKPSPEELAAAPHYLIGIINPDEQFSLAQYRELAYAAIRDIQQRGKIPFLVGGSGLYVWTVVEGWSIPHVPPDPDMRRQLEQQATGTGIDRLYEELAGIDPAAAQKIDPHNVRRVIRALEVIRKTGAPFSQLQKKTPPPFDTLIIGLTAEREKLYRRIDCRVDRMIEAGLVQEVEKLRQMEYDFRLPALSSIGYKQVKQYLDGEVTLEKAVQQVKYETHRFARHQYAWFKPDDERIHWFDVDKTENREVEALVAQFISSEHSRS